MPQSYEDVLDILFILCPRSENRRAFDARDTDIIILILVTFCCYMFNVTLSINVCDVG